LVSPLKLNIDNVGYKTKPEGSQIGSLSNRLKRKNAVVEITDMETVLDAVRQGRTITAGEMDGTKESGWRSQRLFVFDIDNDAETLPKLTPSEVGSLLNDNGIPLSFAYWTFSSTQAQGIKTLMKDIHTEYEKWCGDNGHRYALDSIRLSTELRKKGLVIRKTAGNRVCVLGFGIVCNDNLPPEWQ
jgi:hypothetical protein